MSRIGGGNSASKAAQILVLIAEPEQDMRAVYKALLREWAGPIVDSGRQCIEIALSGGSHFDAIIIDSHIKDPDGLEAAKRILEAKPGQYIIITSTTGWKIRDNAVALKNIQKGQIDVIEKPFGFSDLLAKLYSRVLPPRTSKVGLTDHVLAIYEDEEEEFAEAAAFLKQSIERNEAALFIVGRDYDIQTIKANMISRGLDADALIDEGSLIIMCNEEWYIPERQVDKHRIIAQWDRLVAQSTRAGKKGLRAFCMMDCFFDHDFAEEVVDYEQTLPAKFEMPFVPVCAYRRSDIERLTEDQQRRLILCHSHVWTPR